MKKLIDIKVDTKLIDKRREELSKQLGINMTFTDYINYLIKKDVEK